MIMETQPWKVKLQGSSVLSPPVALVVVFLGLSACLTTHLHMNQLFMVFPHPCKARIKVAPAVCMRETN
jgi:hypothetical protein